MRPAASPKAVESSGQLDARRSNSPSKRKRPTWNPGPARRDEDRDEAVAQRFGLNTELPSPFHGHEHYGKLRDLGDAQGACALLLQIVVAGIFDSIEDSKASIRRCAVTV